MDKPEIHPINRDFAPIETPELASDYLDLARRLYRDDYADYRGRRNEEQQGIAEYLSLEAEEVFERWRVEGRLALGSAAISSTVSVDMLPVASDEEDPPIIGGLRLPDLVKSWRQLYVGFGVLTNRLARDTSKFGSVHKELIELSDVERALVADSLMEDFLKISAYRLGLEGFGLMRNISAYDEEWNVIKKQVDKDLPLNEKHLGQIATKRGLNEEFDDRAAVHTAGKMSPEEMYALRREFSEVDIDDFIAITGFSKNAREVLENRYNQ